MHSSSHFDPQLGLDIHLYPWPLPTPHIGLVFDVFDYLPLLGTTVNVNSIKRSSAGTGGIAVHIPVGGVWVPPFRAPGGPQLDNELFMGSKTVSVDGEPFSRIGMPVLGCNIVGMIPPLRLKRTTKPKQLSLTLPLTFNLALPNNVNVGGPPTINLMALLMKAGLSGLGKGIKKLKKTPKWQQFMERFKKLRKKLFKNMDSGFLKCNMLRAEPVDIRDGSVHLEQQDFVVRGRLPLSWVRYYSSADIDEEGWCGYGWSTPADITLEIMPEEQAAMLHQPEGVMLFPALPDSDGIEHAVNGLPEGARLWREQGSDATCWRVALENNTELHFLGQTGQLPLEKVADFNGNAWLFSRQHGELKAIREFCLLGPTGREIIVTSEHGRLLALRLLDTRTGDLSPLIRYEYNQAGELIAQLDAFSHANTFRYRQRRMVSHIDRLGQGFHYAFDDAWRVVHAWGDGGVWDYHFDYHPLLNEVVVTDSLGHTSRITFDENGLPVSEIDPEGGNTILGYDTLGRTVSLIDPEGRHYRWEYDEQGRIVAEHLPGGGVIHARYNAAGQPLSHIDENGEEWQLQYDERGNLTAQSDPTGVTRRYRYDSLGQLSEADEPGTGITRYQYDDLGFPCAITESGAASLLLRHSVRGNPEQKTDGNGAVTHYFWDRKDRLTAICEPDGREIRFEYDREDRPVCCTDEAGRITRLSYTPTGMLSGCETADGARTLYHYDPEDRLLAVINQTGQRWQLTRDALGRVVTETDYYGQSTHYRWDKSENLIARRDPLGREVRYRYNAAGQLSERRCGDNPDTRYQYDACGRLVLCENPWRRLTWRYDAAGRILCEEQDDFQLRYRWNERGLLLSRESDAGHQVSYAWDGHDRLLGVQLNSDKPVRFSYNAHGQRSHEQLSDEVTRLLSYDPQGRLNAQQVVRGEQPLFSTGFSYDRDGNLTLKQDSLWGDDRYRYDPTGRLLAHCDPQGVIRRFVQDAAGNPFTSVLNESENQPERWSRTGSLNGVRYCFDRAGELRQRQSGQSDAEAEHFVWDEHRQLTAVRRGTRQVRYGYDGLGRRVFKQTDDETRWFYWQGDMLAGEVASAGTPPLQARSLFDTGNRLKRQRMQAQLYSAVREYVYYPGSFQPLALLTRHDDMRQSFHYHCDPNGAPVRLTSLKGDIVWSVQQGAWGEKGTVHSNRIENPLRFQGQYYDAETGLHYNRHRYYDPLIRSYISQDPIGLAGGLNPYQYAPNPLMWIDPLGLTSCKLSKAMENNGIIRPKNSAAHHIVPETARGAQPARDILKKYGIDINGADNGVFLPTHKNTDGMSGILHNGKHPDDYISAINNRIEAADIKGGKQEVINELGRINGTLSGAANNSSWYTILL